MPTISESVRQSADLVVLEVLDGCGPSAATEARSLGDVEVVGPTELTLRTPDALRAIDLRSVVSAYLCVRVPARTPREILETSAMRRIGQQLVRIRAARPKASRFSSLRIAAAGTDTPVMQRLAQELADAAELPLDPDDGDLLVRIRRAERTAGEAPAWEVLIRLTPRPLSTRAWRTVDYPGAVNATIAASVLELLDVRAEDALLDMTCGSGTFLIEQSFRAAAERAVGIDVSAEAIAAAIAHQRAARRKGRIEWLTADARDVALDGEFTCIIANPPWGGLLGDHATNEDLLADLLRRADEWGSATARVGILTHEIRRMHSVLERPNCAWRLVREHRFFQKGHHPRLFHLVRRSDWRHRTD